MICTVDGKPIRPICLLGREMGSGGLPSHLMLQTILIYARDEFIGLLSAAYMVLRQELDNDIAVTGEVADLSESAYMKYSTLHELIAEAEYALAPLLQNYLWIDLLDASFGPNRVDQCQFVVDQFQFIRVENLKVIVGATAYRIRPLEIP